MAETEIGKSANSGPLQIQFRRR